MDLASPIDGIVETLATAYDTPDAALGLAVVRIGEAAAPLLAVLNRAAGQGLSRERDRVLLFRALHVLGAARVPAACQPLLRFLRRPPAEVEDTLGDAVSETLPRIAAGVFDGDAPALLAACGDRRIDEAARWSLLLAAAFLTWDGRIARTDMESFLRRFRAEKMAAPLDAAWMGWGEAVALLGLADLAPAVEEVWSTFPVRLVSPGTFREQLADARAAPDDIERFRSANAGYIEDIGTVLDWTRRTDGEEAGRDLAPYYDDVPQPVTNLLRGVGRNDPCPCGSGKKYKKCCLLT